jgi:DNA-binding transcriptional ArsR family regulator
MNAKKALSEKRRCARVASLFKTLSHPQRLFLLCCLCDGESTVQELQTACGASQPVISQHLTRMRLEGIVESRRCGNSMHYRIADPQIPALIRSMEKIFSA